MWPTLSHAQQDAQLRTTDLCGSTIEPHNHIMVVNLTAMLVVQQDTRASDNSACLVDLYCKSTGATAYAV